MSKKQWLAIAIGNTRIRVAIFSGSELVSEYAYVHADIRLLEMQLGQQTFDWIAIASVVPQLITPWHHHKQSQILAVAQVPLKGIYPTMGIDRALTLWGAGVVYGYPVLVIDAGTALSLTGASADSAFVGGAILPGLNMQMQNLNYSTAALPSVELPERLPQRWATNTVGAIQSGVLYGFIAGVESFVEDWRSRYPQSKIIVTGGEGERICQYLQTPNVLDSRLIFWGIREIWRSRSEAKIP